VNQTGELRQQIEDMALQLVVGEPENGASPSAWLPVLEKIAAAAAREHAAPVAGAAAGAGATTGGSAVGGRTGSSGAAPTGALPPR